LGQVFAVAVLDLPLILDGTANGSQEVLEVALKLCEIKVEIPVQKVKELSLHKINFVPGKAELGEILVRRRRYRSISSPMFVLWAGVVEEFGREDKAREEDAVSRASQTLGNGWELLLETVKVQECCH
jgi:hypothetical protein